MSIIRKTIFVAAIIANFFAWQGTSLSADWETGPALQRRLAEPVDVFWANNPLRQAIENLSETRRVAIVIDRRVDPSRELNVSLNNVPFETALNQMSQSVGLGASRMGDVFYIGPSAAADRFSNVTNDFKQSVRRIPAAARLKFYRRSAMRWDDLAEPRSLIEQLARDNGLTIERLELLPHDLWAAADLPPLSLADRLSLIAFQFDLTFKISADGRRLELVPLPKIATEASGDQSRSAASRTPPKKPSDSSPADLRQLRIERLTVQKKPLGPVLVQLARRLKLELRLDRQAIAAANVSLDQRVSIKVENVTIDELFTELLRDTGLKFRRAGRVIEISPTE